MDDNGSHHPYDDLGVGVAKIAFDGSWISANTALCDLLGYSPNDLTGRPFDAVFKIQSEDSKNSFWQRLTRGEIHG